MVISQSQAMEDWVSYRLTLLRKKFDFKAPKADYKYVSVMYDGTIAVAVNPIKTNQLFDVSFPPAIEAGKLTGHFNEHMKKFKLELVCTE